MIWLICVTQVTCSTLSRGELEEMFDPNLCSDKLFVGCSFPLQTPVKCSNLIYMHGLWEEAGHHAKTRTFFFLRPSWILVHGLQFRLVDCCTRWAGWCPGGFPSVRFSGPCLLLLHQSPNQPCCAVPEINSGKEANTLGESNASHLNPLPFVFLEAGLNFLHRFYEHLSLKSFELAFLTCHFSPLHLMVSKYRVYYFLVFFLSASLVTE